MKNRKIPYDIKRKVFNDLDPKVREGLSVSNVEDIKVSHRKIFRRALLKMARKNLRGKEPLYGRIAGILEAHKTNLVAHEIMMDELEAKKWAIVKSIGKNTPTKENLFGLIF